MSRRRKVLAVAVLSAGGLALGTGTASAQVASDTDAAISVSLPITVCGTGIGLLGTAVGECPPPTTAAPVVAVDPSAVTSGGVLSGTSALVSVDAPVTVCGNAVGSATGGCAAPSAPATTAPPAPATTAPAPATGGGVASGTRAAVGVNAPITACGNAVGVLGGDPSSASCAPAGSGSASATVAPGAGGGLLSGTGLGVDANLPLTVCGNAVGLLGWAGADCADATGTAGPPAAVPPATLPPAPTTSPTSVAGGGGAGDPLGAAIVADGGGGAAPLADASPSRPSGPQGVERLAVTGAVIGIATLLGLGVLLVGSGGLTSLLARVRAG